MIDYDINWGSHLPILIKVMQATSGDVLEIGSGLYSTPVLYWLCKDQGRKFVSYDSDKEWIKEYTTFVDNWDNADIEKLWDVVLIDHRPSQRRIIEIKRVANRAKYVVVHDTQRNRKFCDYQQIYPLFKYRYDYTKAIPYTTVLSNFNNLEFLNENK